ncbi:hypothetical protein [Yoonia sp. BS5-3]|uniref:Lipoprotein with Yx(FWY)xxD motif n=1 Tax=Yoonia phaeophyticola TaxID=3137369 RepID=A0ABZ2V4C9_9RHOB
MKLFSAIALGLFVAGCSDAYAFEATQVAVKFTPPATTGTHLTTAEGMTLYTFARDEPHLSHCYDNCARTWQPYQVDFNAEVDGLTIIMRHDGIAQWAKDGAPLYLWAGDVVPGQKTGDGIAGLWRIAE